MGQFFPVEEDSFAWIYLVQLLYLPLDGYLGLSPVSGYSEQSASGHSCISEFEDLSPFLLGKDLGVKLVGSQGGWIFTVFKKLLNISPK